MNKKWFSDICIVLELLLVFGLQDWNFPVENNNQEFLRILLSKILFKKPVSESRFYDKHEDNKVM